MEREYQLTEASLREDLDDAIEYLKGALEGFGEPIPPRVRECLSVDVLFSCARLAYNADAAELRKALGRLRLMREDLRRGTFPELTAASLARAVVALDPFAVSFFEGSCWTGGMARLTKSENLFSLGNDPILFPVRGADKRSAERKIAWLLCQLGVPAGSRSESSFVAAQERAA